ncbi:unnamed protein product [Caenorhabditis angaria]|uniref:DUF1907 domain-containing protein n=1 Tax=Caenorhabditis angaria TaxID=860376 RepID=A0A9P1N8N3_9PELO|nr:unnamed protein product [Caenorhabditis angaria]
MPDCSSKLSTIIDNYIPSLSELVPVIRFGLQENFENVHVEISECPDLSKSPFNLTSSGFAKNLKIAEVGGPGNLYPGFNIDHQFDFEKIGEICEHSKASIFGPGAGPWPIVGVNCEMVADVNLKTGKTSTKIAKIDESSKKGYVMNQINEPKFSLMANLALSDADDRTQPVIHIKAAIRKGQKNFTIAIRDAIQNHFGEKVISLAGIFIIEKGSAKLHVMPGFPGCPFKDEEEVSKWIKYFEMSAPLICTSVLHSYDPGHNLRLEHTHCYSNHGDAGHYHYDTTPDIVEYQAWFAPAHKIYRIDECQPR